MPKDKYKNNSIYEPIKAGERLQPMSIILPIIVAGMILMILFVYTRVERKNVVDDVEDVTNQVAEYIAENVANTIDYAKSSIKLSVITVAQSMTGEELENPADVILPMVDSTPFNGIEYIRADGMNVVTIGEAFDASDRVYYIEGMKGNSGIWVNYHPKTAKENLMNFYTPLVYEGKIVGVITGYIRATTQIASLFETELYGQRIHGFILDENDMVICSTIKTDFVPDMTFDVFMEKFGLDATQRKGTLNTIKQAGNTAASFKNPLGEGRICVVSIPSTQWKLAIITPDESFKAIIGENTRNSVTAIVLISAVLLLYGAVLMVNAVKTRKVMTEENEKLAEENRLSNEKNLRAFLEISEIRDIIASAKMGTWNIELIDGEAPKMFVDDTMRELLGIQGGLGDPAQTYSDWFDHIKPEAVPSVLKSVDRMKEGFFDENTYLWVHPTKGMRYVRCGGTAQKISGGFSLRGYHYDVDQVVRKEQEQMNKLQKAMNEKKEYYETLGTLGDVFYSMHVLDLVADTSKEFTSRNEVKEIVNREQGAREMMREVMKATLTDEYLQAALDFTDLDTLAERMQGKKVVSRQFIGKRTGWFLASFITMEADEDDRPTKVIFTTRVIDEEKKAEEQLIHKSQTDELTGLLNRRAYEENIYKQNDIPSDSNYIYVSLDLNGLKVINDTQGHMAGDEIIRGACQCMTKCLGPYGRLYRIGGDEFVAVIFCDEDKLKDIFADFDKTMANWKGDLVDSLSISYGWASNREMPEASVRQLGSVAEKRMYEAKSRYYRRKGVDRRGQQDAHKALCDTYTKILKINITEDSYQIANMKEEEKNEAHGFSDKISVWLHDFGVSGQVHPEDLEEYLKRTDTEFMKEYFKSNTTLLIFYRRRYGETYKRVMMEIIPANDYAEDNQSLFLYVKDLEK